MEKVSRFDFAGHQSSLVSSVEGEYGIPKGTEVKELHIVYCNYGFFLKLFKHYNTLPLSVNITQKIRKRLNYDTEGN